MDPDNEFFEEWAEDARSYEESWDDSRDYPDSDQFPVIPEEE